RYGRRLTGPSPWAGLRPISSSWRLGRWAAPSSAATARNADQMGRLSWYLTFPLLLPAHSRAFDSVALQPILQQGHLPEFRPAQRREMLLRLGQQLFNKLTPEQSAPPRLGSVEHVLHELQIRPLQILQRRHGKIP